CSTGLRLLREAAPLKRDSAMSPLPSVMRSPPPSGGGPIEAHVPGVQDRRDARSPPPSGGGPIEARCIRPCSRAARRSPPPSGGGPIEAAHDRGVALDGKRLRLLREAAPLKPGCPPEVVHPYPVS